MKKIGLLLLILLVMAVPVAAQEPPTEVAKDNWCFNPAIWAGDCGDGTTFESQWHWICGWYMAHYESGDISREFIATRTFCRALLPPLVITPPTVEQPTPDLPVLECYTNGTIDFDYNGIAAIGNSNHYDGGAGTCTGIPFHVSTLVVANDEGSASAACVALGLTPGVVNPAAFGFSSPANYWHCAGGIAPV